MLLQSPNKPLKEFVIITVTDCTLFILLLSNLRSKFSNGHEILIYVLRKGFWSETTDIAELGKKKSSLRQRSSIQFSQAIKMDNFTKKHLWTLISGVTHHRLLLFYIKARECVCVLLYRLNSGTFSDCFTSSHEDKCTTEERERHRVNRTIWKSQG